MKLPSRQPHAIFGAVEDPISSPRLAINFLQTKYNVLNDNYAILDELQYVQCGLKLSATTIAQSYAENSI